MPAWQITKTGRGGCAPANAGAFTLVELLVSMTVLVLLVTLLGRLSIQATGAWGSGESNKERLQNLRAISDLLGSELQGALLPTCRTNTSGLQFVVNPTQQNVVSSTYLNHDAIFWQAPIASDQTYGNVAEVGYFVSWDSTNPSRPRAQLCRFFVNPATSTAGQEGANPNFLIYQQQPSPQPTPPQPTPSPWLSDNILATICPATASKLYQGLFADNVVGLWTVCLDPLGNKIITPLGKPTLADGNDAFDSRDGYSYIDTTSTVTPPPSLTRAACALPAAVQVSFALLDSDAASRVGPAQQTAILADVTASKNAAAFISMAKTDTQLQAVWRGMRSYQTVVYLQNGK